VTASIRLVTVRANKLQAASKSPDVDNVKGGALAAATICVPKTSVLSSNYSWQGFAPCFFFRAPRMATAADVRRIAMGLEGTTSAPHFDRTAFKVRRIYATLAGDGVSVNLLLTPDEQQFKTMLAPVIFSALPNAWGRQGWTLATLAEIDVEELEAVMRMAW
jgi:hypothetical protein